MVTEVALRKIDADTHITLPVDYNDLRDLLPRTQATQAKEMMWRETQRFMDPNGVRASVGAETRGAARGSGGVDGNPDNIEFRLEQMERLGFDMQVLVAQTALPDVQAALGRHPSRPRCGRATRCAPEPPPPVAVMMRSAQAQAGCTIQLRKDGHEEVSPALF